MHAEQLAYQLVQGLVRRFGPDPFWVRVVQEQALLVHHPDDIRLVLGGSPDPFASDPDAKRKGMAAFQPDALTISRGDLWQNRRMFAESRAGHRQRHCIGWPDASSAWSARRRTRSSRAARCAGRTSTRVPAAHPAGRVRRRCGRRRVDLRRAGRADVRGQPDAGQAGRRLRRRSCTGCRPTWMRPSRAACATWSPTRRPTNTPRSPASWCTGCSRWGTRCRRTCSARWRCWRRIRCNSPRCAPNWPAPTSTQPGRASRRWTTSPAACRTPCGCGRRPSCSAGSTTRDVRFPTGAVLPAGTQVLIYNLFNHRNRDRIPYADRFAPEEWVDAATRRADWSFNFFSHGPQGCPGAGLAMFLGQAVLARLLGTLDAAAVAARACDPASRCRTAWTSSASRSASTPASRSIGAPRRADQSRE